MRAPQINKQRYLIAETVRQFPLNVTNSHFRLPFRRVRYLLQRRGSQVSGRPTVYRRYVGISWQLAHC